MPLVDLDFKHAGVPEQVHKRLVRALLPEIKRMRQVQDYHDVRASIHLPDDIVLREEVSRLARSFRKTEAIIVAGVGGSSLGTIAIQQAVLSRKNGSRSPRIFFLETFDAKAFRDLLEDVKKQISRKRIIVNVISKSGTTTETVAGMSVLLRLLKGTLRDQVVLTTDGGSPLASFGQENQIRVLNIPVKVGGRYSALSAVGLFPLALLGLDIVALQEGAREMRDRCLSDQQDNPAVLGAITLAHQHVKGRRIVDTFVFAPELEGIARWYRQLLAESTGKEFSASGKRKLNAGFIPLVSVGSADLHSMAQTFLGGRDTIYHTIISARDMPALAVPPLPGVDALVPGIAGRSLGELMDATRKGFMEALRLRKRPFGTIELESTQERAVGALMQLKMMETMYLCALLGVNAFDQPNVEEYKQEMRRILTT